MITCERLDQHPNLFPTLTGQTQAEFDRLAADFADAQQRHRAETTHTKRGFRQRQRATGAGRRHTLDSRTRLLLTLVWLRLYPTYQLLGWLFGLDKSNAWRNVQDVLEVLTGLAHFPLERPAADRSPLETADALFAAFPSVKLIVDAKEQPVQRPQGWDNQKPFYSGKKKRHTVKTQIACTPEGRIGAVSPSVPGSVHDLEVLRHSGLMDNLAADEGVMADKGYTGLDKDGHGVPIVLPQKKPRGQELSEPARRRNRMISRCRVVVEHVLAQCSRFQVLKQVFRSVLGRHSWAMRVVALLVDRRSALTPLKTFPVAG